jgi:hypothetical protein
MREEMTHPPSDAAREVTATIASGDELIVNFI